MDNPAIALQGPAPQVYTVGKIVEHSWGYDQTNIDFYEIVGRSAKFVTLRRVASQMVQTPDAPWMTGRSVPDVGNFVAGPIRRKVILGRGTEIGVGSPNGCGWADLWSGKPSNWSAYA